LRDAALLLALGGGVLLLGVVGVLGIYRLQGPPTPIPIHSPAALDIFATTLFYLTILVGVWLLVVRRFNAAWSALGLRVPLLSDVGYAALPLVAIAGGCTLLIAGLRWGLATKGLAMNAEVITPVPGVASSLFVPSVLGSVLLIPVAEEVLFRGILYQALRQRVGVAIAALVSAVGFAALHAQPSPSAAIVFLPMGILFAAAFERTRSLYPSMLLHATYNGVIVLLGLGVI
jgi:membrane protease YdiL (CAAX protease family)